jgi:hypothetical protein
MFFLNRHGSTNFMTIHDPHKCYVPLRMINMTSDMAVSATSAKLTWQHLMWQSLTWQTS